MCCIYDDLCLYSVLNGGQLQSGYCFCSVDEDEVFVLNNIEGIGYGYAQQGKDRYGPNRVVILRLG